MAKVGEGDARWIVEEREDGTNVHNWHWAERDVTAWSQKRLSELLGNLALTDAAGGQSLTASTSEDVSVTGEAVVNNRKNKLIPAYELEIKGAWSGKLTDANGKAVDVSGQWRIPYLAEENSDEDPELVVSTSFESEAGRKAKELLLKAGKQIIYEKVRQFVKEIQAGGPVAKDGQAPAQPAPGKSKGSTSAPAAAPAKPPPAAKSGGKRTFKTVEKFYARPRDLFECFTDAQRILAYTQSPAKVVPKEGGEFEIFGGSVVGKFTGISANARLVLDWRFRNWQEADVSKVEIILEEPEEGTTVLTLVHSGIPEEDQFGNEGVFETTANGWKQQIFHRIRAVFGFGLGL